jgi:tetratricopeptide (TPR) repeat protein
MADLDHIEDYFEGRCTDTEKQTFEERCTVDQDFAENVAFYVQTRQLLREELLNQKRTEWRRSAKSRPLPWLRTRYIAIAMATAAVLLLFSLYLVIKPSGPAQLANQYIHSHYNRLSQTMSGAGDNLQLGITAYNNGSFPLALQRFTAFAHTHPGNADALLFTGLVYLRQNNYDQALQQFDTLAAKPALYSNPGPFLKAVTLLQRDAAGDRIAARQLLREIVQKQLDGSTEAAAWLKEF